MKHLDKQVRLLRSCYDEVVDLFGIFLELELIHITFDVDLDFDGEIIIIRELTINEQTWDVLEYGNFEDIPDSLVIDSDYLDELEQNITILIEFTAGNTDDFGNIIFTREGVEEYLKNKKL